MAVDTELEVLFVCVHNAGRSQMAAGLVGLRSGGRVRVRSAGSAPASEITPAVVQAMTEVGVDLSEEYPKPLTDQAVRAADVVITMGCGDACPVFPGKRYEEPYVTRSTRASTNSWPSSLARPGLARRAFTEAVATFVLVFAGCGAIVANSERDQALGTVGIAAVFGLDILGII